MVFYKIIKYLMLVLGAIALVMGIWLFASDNISLVQPMMLMSYVVFALILVLVLIFVIRDIFRGNIKRTLISLVSFGVIFAIAYFTSDGTSMLMRDGNMLSAEDSKLIGAGLKTFYILAVIAILAMLFLGPIKKLTDNK